MPAAKKLNSFDQQSTPVPINNWWECFLSAQKKTGFVCTFKLPEKEHRFWGLNDIPQMIGYAEALENMKSNMHLALNAFRYGSRKESDLLQIRNIGVDLDIHKIDITPNEAIDEIQCMIIDQSLPEPNLLIHSGQGLQLVYGITGGAAPQMTWLSRYITTQYISKLSFLNADPQASDPTRVFRFPNTINQKVPARSSVEIWNPNEYSLQDLYQFVTPLEEIRKKKKKKKKKPEVVIFSPPGVVSLYTLNTKKKDDLEKLVELRQDKPFEKYRNTFLYTYSFTIALILKDEECTVTFARNINQKFHDPEENLVEVERTAKSGYEDAIQFLKEFGKNDYKMMGLDRYLVKPEKSSTIIEKLNITSEEMEHFRVLIGREVKRQRNTDYQREKRRLDGAVDREEYLQSTRKKVDEKLECLELAIKEHPEASNAELSRITKIPRSTIIRLKKQLGVHSMSL
ncbi:hypothetical protein SAMN04487866_12618 [Thermoactinomyces sp. DSM 45891]|uniref:hypothetical protein n=1 Tax=Thermoactinomyces sp. DSM 45891 TaxID=1761907 RepID=UPI000917B727|nr:hypothetical protein [Thermoactinomyces sp. DSM 45891]SFX79390.1 hypothetical protein SAMN04487866_12618 [Thermoactinomyces sp. DSM 45891]